MSEDFKIEFNKGKDLDFNFHGKLYKEDFANNPKLLQLFNFFDKDGNGIIESDSIQGNEFLNIFGYMKAAAELREGDGNKKLDAQEAALLGIFVKGLKGVSSGDIFEFLDIINSKKDVVINSKHYRSSDGTLTVVNSYQGGGEETVIYDQYGNIRFKIREQHLKESFIGAIGQQANGETKYKNEDGHSVSIKDGETEGSIVVSQDSIKYFKDKYNIDVAGAYFKNGIVEFIDKDGNPILHLTYDMAPDVKDELRSFIGKNLKESSEYLLNIPKSLGWLDKLGVSIQDYKFELNPAQWSLLGFHSAGLEKLNEYMEQARKNYEDGKALEESSSAQPGFFDSKLERMSGNKDIDYLAVERFRLTNMKYQEVKAINQRLDALKEGLKEAKRCYRNWETEKASSGRTHYEPEEKDFRGATMKALTEFFNGDERVAGQFIQSLNSELINKEDIEKNYLKILERVIKGAEEEKNKVLDGESEDKLKSRYQKEYKSIYGNEDITDVVEELTNNGKEAGGTMKLGMLTAIQIALGAFTGGTGNAALTAFLGYLETIGIDAALTTSNILSRAQDWDENATEELKQSVKGTAGFVGFGIVAANPFSKMIGKLTGKGYNALMKWFGVEEAGGLSKAFEKGAIKGAVRKGSGAVTETTITASQAFEWLAVKSSEMVGEIGAFAGYEIATMDEDFITALDGNAKMLTKLKVMNSAIGVMLGSLIKNRAIKGQIKKAIKSYEETLKNAGLDNVKITENKTPTKTTYTIEIDGQKFICNSP